MQKHEPHEYPKTENVPLALSHSVVDKSPVPTETTVSPDLLIKEAYHSLIADFKAHFARNNREVTNADLALIDKAFHLANELHQGMFRKSGEPYILHPIAVARIVINEIGLETVSVVCALLHDVVEDTNITVADLQRDFGDKIAHIVDGLTKIRTVLKDKNKQSLLVSNNDHEEKDRAETVRREMIEKADNIRKIIMTLGDDIRVIIIKVADRLHNMRTMDSMPPKKQMSISDETLFFYAPIAHRLGLYAIKSELEDLCLKYTSNTEYKEIAKKLESKKNERERYIQEFIEPIKSRIVEKGEIPKFRIFGRPKHIYSIYNKIHTKNVPFEDIFDLFAIRIVIDCAPDHETEHDLCWKVFHVVTLLYPHYKQDRLRDWVTKPKSNGYESLHVTVMNNDGKWVEVQIRTERMDTVAEKGVAAHWIYKDAGTNSKNKSHTAKTTNDKNTKGTADQTPAKVVRKGKNKTTDTLSSLEMDEENNKNATGIKGFNDWINEIREQLKDSQKTSIEVVTDVKHTLYEQEIFVFSPKGQVLTLKKGATVLDFAFAIHTDLGCTCIGGKIDGKLYPISHKLKNGEQVEIITSKKAKPTPEWLNFAVTSKARNKIKSQINYEKEQDLRQNAKMGEEILQRRLSNNYKVKYNNDLLNELQVYFKYRDTQEFLATIGAEQFDWNRMKELKIVGDRFVFPSAKDNKSNVPIQNESYSKGIEDQDIFHEGISIFEGFADRIDYGTAQCCNAQPGDLVYGFLTIGNGIKIHRTSCPNAPDHYRHPYRIVNIKWAKSKDLLYLMPLFIKGIDDVGVVNRISNLISGELKLNMRSISFDSIDGIFAGKIEVYVATEAEGKQLIKRLKNLEGIYSVDQNKQD